MAKVLISGYYGFDNAGDDTVLYGIISSLRRHIGDVEIAVLSNKPEETKSLFGVSAYNRWKPSEIIAQLKKCDLLVMGGGSLLQDATSPRSVIYYLGIVTLAKMLGKPVIFYAQGIGPISHPLSKKLIRWVVNWVDVITVRDRQSGEDLHALGVNRATVHVTADPALTINPEEIPMEIGRQILSRYQVLRNDNEGKPRLAISVRNWKNESNYITELAKWADHILDRGWEIYLLPMQYPADVSPSQEIILRMNHPAKEDYVFLLNQKMNFREIISVIGNMDFVLGMRLHSVILSAVMNVPFAGISYDPKMDRFVERLDMELAGNIRELDHERMGQNVDVVLNHLTEVKGKLMENMSILVKEAEKGSLFAREILEKK